MNNVFSHLFISTQSFIDMGPPVDKGIVGSKSMIFAGFWCFGLYEKSLVLDGLKT